MRPHKTKSIRHSWRDDQLREEEAHRMGENIYQPCNWQRINIRIYKELQKTNDTFRFWVWSESSKKKKKRVKMAKKYLKKCPLSLAIREIKTKTTLRVYLTRVRMPKANKTTDNVSGRGYGENGTIIHWECKLVQPFWKPMWRTLKKLKINLLGKWPDTPHPILQILAQPCSPPFCSQ